MSGFLPGGTLLNIQIDIELSSPNTHLLCVITLFLGKFFPFIRLDSSRPDGIDELRKVFREKVERNFLFAWRIPLAEIFPEYWEKNPEREFLSLMSKNI